MVREVASVEALPARRRRLLADLGVRSCRGWRRLALPSVGADVRGGRAYASQSRRCVRMDRLYDDGRPSRRGLTRQDLGRKAGARRGRRRQPAAPRSDRAACGRSRPDAPTLGPAARRARVSAVRSASPGPGHSPPRYRRRGRWPLGGRFRGSGTSARTRTLGRLGQMEVAAGHAVLVRVDERSVIQLDPAHPHEPAGELDPHEVAQRLPNPARRGRSSRRR